MIQNPFRQPPPPCPMLFSYCLTEFLLNKRHVSIQILQANYPLLLRRLWNLLKVIWRKGKIPDEWQREEGIFTPKEKNFKHISQFRTISLLNVEGKIFFAILARRLSTYLTTNGYVDTSVQKGGVPGFSGCVEHTSAISQLIREAKVNN